MILYEGAEIRVRVDPELSEEFAVKVGMHQGSVLSTFFEWWKMLLLKFPQGVLSELMYADDLVLLSETIGGLRN